MQGSPLREYPATRTKLRSILLAPATSQLVPNGDMGDHDVGGVARRTLPLSRLQANRDCVGLNSSELESNFRMRRNPGTTRCLMG
jgi:hypothetical protein